MQVEVTGAEEAKAAVAAVAAAIADKPALHARIAKGARPVVSNWLLDRDGKAKRKPGWPRSGYWGHAAESASGEADAAAAWVIIRKEGVGLHLRGGTVTSRRPVHIRPSVVLRAGAPAPVRPDGFAHRPEKRPHPTPFDATGQRRASKKTPQDPPRALQPRPLLDRNAVIRLRRILHTQEKAAYTSYLP